MNEQYEEKIEELYFELFGKLMVYARSTLGNEALAEEAVQECCSKLMELGFDLKEAEKFFREKVGEVYSLQDRKIG